MINEETLIHNNLQKDGRMGRPIILKIYHEKMLKVIHSSYLNTIHWIIFLALSVFFEKDKNYGMIFYINVLLRNHVRFLLNLNSV